MQFCLTCIIWTQDNPPLLCLWGIAECSGTISLGPVDVTLNFWSVKTQLSNIQKSAYDKQLQQNGECLRPGGL